MIDDGMLFGLSNEMCRSFSGALLSRQIEHINDFLCHHGLVVAELFDGYVVIVHPSNVRVISGLLKQYGGRHIFMASSLNALRLHFDLTAPEIRVLEVFTPGPIALLHDEDHKENGSLIVIPDSFDIRDICNLFGGYIESFFFGDIDSAKETKELLKGIGLEKYGIQHIGEVSPPEYDIEYKKDHATIVNILGSGEVQLTKEGRIKLDEIRKASNQLSIWEIREWE